MTGPRRRDVLRGFAAAGLGAAAGVAGGWVASETLRDEGTASGALESPPGAPGRVHPHGAHQAGIARPATPQPHGVMAVLDLHDAPPSAADPAFAVSLRALVAQLGVDISSLTAPLDSDEATTDALPDGAGDLSVTVGLGPRVIAAVDPSLPGAQPLPRFASDGDLAPDRVGGDIMLAAYSSDPNAARHAVSWLAARIPGASIRWIQRLFRGPGRGTVTRNPLGFHDGIIVPHGAELDEHVWIPDGPFAGGTLCVIRRLRLQASRFEAEPRARQESIIGRRKGDGTPLSGGKPLGEVDLLAKSPEGDFIVPARSHVRAAHPSFTGSNLMLRRGYAFDDGPIGDDPEARDAGLMFTCFQRDLRTFVQTQHRLDETDDLMAYVTPTASATFLVLPGFAPDRPLGSSIRPAG